MGGEVKSHLQVQIEAMGWPRLIMQTPTTSFQHQKCEKTAAATLRRPDGGGFDGSKPKTELQLAIRSYRSSGS